MFIIPNIFYSKSECLSQVVKKIRFHNVERAMGRRTFADNVVTNQVVADNAGAAGKRLLNHVDQGFRVSIFDG